MLLLHVYWLLSTECCRIKKEKILRKSEEVQEMLAIQSHLEEQIQILISQFQEYSQSKLVLEHRLRATRGTRLNLTCLSFPFLKANGD